MTVEQLNNRFLHANFDGYPIINFPFIQPWFSQSQSIFFITVSCCIAKQVLISGADRK